MTLVKKIIRKVVGYAFDNFIHVDKESSVGKYTFIGQNSSITKTKIGNYCSIGTGVMIGLGEHDLSKPSTSSCFYHGNTYQELTKKNIVIEHDVWIGANAIVLRGVVVNTGSVIAAGAVVTKNVPPYAVVAGVPAKIIKYRFEQDKINGLLNSNWWNENKNEAAKVLEKFK